MTPSNPNVPPDHHNFQRSSSWLPEFSSCFKRPFETSQCPSEVPEDTRCASNNNWSVEMDDDFCPSNFVSCELSPDETENCDHVNLPRMTPADDSRSVQFNVKSSHSTLTGRAPQESSDHSGQLRTRLRPTSSLPFNCPMCLQEFSGNTALSRHIQRCACAIASRSTRLHKCSACFRLFASHGSLQTHRGTCLGFLGHGDGGGQVVPNGLVGATSLTPQCVHQQQRQGCDRLPSTGFQNTDRDNSRKMVKSRQTWTPEVQRDASAPPSPPPPPFSTIPRQFHAQIVGSPQVAPPPLLYLGRDEFRVDNSMLLEKNKFFVCQLCHMELPDWPAAARHSMEPHLSAV